MTSDLGEIVWIDCEVKHGVFPDERQVVIDAPEGRWIGFVNVACLRDEILDGRTAVRAKIVETRQGARRARLPGQTEARQYLTVGTT